MEVLSVCARIKGNPDLIVSSIPITAHAEEHQLHMNGKTTSVRVKLDKQWIVWASVEYVYIWGSKPPISVRFKETCVETLPVPWPTLSIWWSSAHSIGLPSASLIRAIEERNKEMSSLDCWYNNFTPFIPNPYMTKLDPFGHGLWQGNLFLLFRGNELSWLWTSLMWSLNFLMHTTQAPWHTDKQLHLKNNAHTKQYSAFHLLTTTDLSKQQAHNAKYFPALRNHVPSAFSAEHVHDVRDAYHVMLN